MRITEQIIYRVAYSRHYVIERRKNFGPCICDGSNLLALHAKQRPTMALSASERLLNFIFVGSTANARRNRIAVRTGFRMAKERADTLIELRRDDMFEAACLRLSLCVFDGKSVSEEAFGEAMAADDIARAA